MAHKVIKAFRDLEDNNTLYKVGDEYPKGNHKPTKKRLKELSELHPKYKAEFIVEVETEEEKNDREEKEAKAKADQKMKEEAEKTSSTKSNKSEDK